MAEKNVIILGYVNEQCLFFYKIWTEEELNNMNGFGPGEVRSVKEQYQPFES